MGGISPRVSDFPLVGLALTGQMAVGEVTDASDEPRMTGVTMEATGGDRSSGMPFGRMLS
jgi:hypothetical protein